MEVHLIKRNTDNVYFRKLYLHPKQDIFIKALAEYLDLGTSLHVHAIRGFIYRACRHWQVRNCQPFSSVLDLNGDDRFKFWIQFISIIIELMSRCIKGENELKYERMLRESFTLYQAHFMEE